MEEELALAFQGIGRHGFQTAPETPMSRDAGQPGISRLLGPFQKVAAEIEVPEYRALRIGFFTELGAGQENFRKAQCGEVLEYPGSLDGPGKAEDES